MILKTFNKIVPGEFLGAGHLVTRQRATHGCTRGCLPDLRAGAFSIQPVKLISPCFWDCSYEVFLLKYLKYMWNKTMKPRGTAWWFVFVRFYSAKYFICAHMLFYVRVGDKRVVLIKGQVRLFCLFFCFLRM